MGEKEGSIIFGGFDAKYKLNKDETITWIPIMDHYYWTIALIDIRKEFEGFKNRIRISEKEDPIRMCPKGCNAVLDTGTFLIYGP